MKIWICEYQWLTPDWKSFIFDSKTKADDILDYWINYPTVKEEMKVRCRIEVKTSEGMGM